MDERRAEHCSDLTGNCEAGHFTAKLRQRQGALTLVFLPK